MYARDSSEKGARILSIPFYTYQSCRLDDRVFFQRLFIHRKSSVCDGNKIRNVEKRNVTPPRASTWETTRYFQAEISSQVTWVEERISLSKNTAVTANSCRQKSMAANFRRDFVGIRGKMWKGSGKEFKSKETAADLILVHNFAVRWNFYTFFTKCALFVSLSLSFVKQTRNAAICNFI